MTKYRILKSSVSTLEGYGIEGILHKSQNIDKTILQPHKLRGLSPKIDPASALSVLPIIEHEMILSHFTPEKIGIIIGTRLGNHQMARSYSEKIRRKAASPSTYSVSGYNMCAGLSALSEKYKGPSVVLPGKQISFCEILILGMNYLSRNDAEAMLIGQVDITDNGDWGLGIFVSIIASDSCKDGISLTIDNNLDSYIAEFPDCKFLQAVREKSPQLEEALKIHLYCSDYDASANFAPFQMYSKIGMGKIYLS